MIASDHQDICKTAVVVLNFNGWRDTIDCIESIISLRNDTGVFLVDNASTDGSAERILAWSRDGLARVNAARQAGGEPPVGFRHVVADARQAPGPDWPPEGGGLGAVTFIETGRNGGYAAGNNVGLRFALAADYRYFWILNNDTLLHPDALTCLIRRMEDDPRIGLCGSTLVYYDEPEIVQNHGGGTYHPWRGRSSAIGLGARVRDGVDPSDVERRLSFVSGASTLVTREFLQTIGLMEESYFLFWEEIDWAFRAHGRFRLGFAPRSIVYHRVGASIGTRDGGEQSELAEFYLMRGRFLFCRRYSKRSLPFVLADLGRSMLRRCRRGEWMRALRLLRAAAGGHLPADRAGVPARTAGRVP